MAVIFEKIIENLLGTWPGAVIVIFSIFFILYLISADFRKMASEFFEGLTKFKINKNGLSISRIPKVNSSTPDQSKPEIEPKQSKEDTSTTDHKSNEHSLIFNMWHAANNKNRKNLDENYQQLLKLSDRKITDEEINDLWFRLRIVIGEDIEGELLNLSLKNPNWFFPYLYLAKLYLNFDAISKSTEYLDKAFQRADNNNKKRAAHYLKDELLTRSKGRETAIEYLQSTEHNSEWNDSANYLLSRIAEHYEKTGKKTNQQFALEKSLELAPTDIELRFKLAFSYAKDKTTYLLAVYHYDLILQKNPEHTSALNNLALLYEKLGNDGEYNKLLIKAVELGNSHAKGNYIVNLLEKGLLNQAETILESLTDAERNDLRILDSVRHLQRTKDTQKEQREKTFSLINTYKNNLRVLTDSPLVDSSKLVGVWQHGNTQFTCNIDTSNKVTGTYIKRETISKGLMFPYVSDNVQTSKKYNISGDYILGILDIICTEETNNSEKLSILSLISLNSISLRLFYHDEQLKGFKWEQGNIPSEVTFNREINLR